MKPNHYENTKIWHYKRLIAFALCAALMLFTAVSAFGAAGDECNCHWDWWSWSWVCDGIEACNGNCYNKYWFTNQWVGNGHCNWWLNCSAFGYDGGDCLNCFIDDDGDGYAGTPAACSEPGAVPSREEWCDDDPTVNPGVAEICDLIDNDCDGAVDEGLTMVTYYRDSDGDLYGSSSQQYCSAALAAADGFTATVGGDCNDNDASIHPGAAEQCDAVDHNCDGDNFNGLALTTYYRDADNDGYGDPGTTHDYCSETIANNNGYITDNTDCDDGNSAVNPGEAEVCDGVDNNCDTQTDEGFLTTTYYRDSDGDGFGDPGNSVTTCMPMPAGYVVDGTDCDDANADIHPGGNDVCGDGIDQDCAGGDKACEPGDNCNCDWRWRHGRWEWHCRSGWRYDCNMDCRNRNWINRRTNNGNCDPELNCEAYNWDAPDCVVTYDCYEDADGDGYGDPDGATLNVGAGTCPAGYADNNLDCDDLDSAINPAASEICDNIDNNCDGNTDEGLPVFTYYQDGDGDGYGDPTVSMDACSQPGNFVSDNTDCDDSNADIHPGAYDLCENGLDEDCNGSDRVCGATSNVCADLSDFPLETQVEAAPPIVMLLMDDSGSMAWSTLCPEDNGLFLNARNYWYVDEYWKSQWAGYNGIYYNPDLDYVPWPDTGTTTYDDADMDAPKVHPHSGTTRTLGNEFDSLDGVSVKWSHYYVWSTMENAPYLVNITGSGGSYSLDYYKVDSCGNGACSTDHSYVRGYTLDNNPPTDVVSGRPPTEERQNFANWYQYYHTRQLTAISAIVNVVNSVEGMKIGLHTVNHNNGVNMIAPRDVDTNRGPILDDLYNVGANGYTPLRRALEDVGDYYADDTNGPYSDSNNGGDCQQAYTIMMTDGYYNGYDPSVGNADGDSNTDYDGGKFGDTYTNTLADVAMAYYEVDLNSTLANLVPTSPQDMAPHQHMVTYSVSFGLSGSFNPDDYPDCPVGNCPAWPDVDEHSENEDSITDLWHAAVNGRGRYMQANNAQQLAYALVSLMQDVSKREGSGASVAVNSHELKQGSKMYQGTYNSAGWTGDLKGYSINHDGSVDQTPVWSAAGVLDARVTASGHGDRDIYTMGASGGVEFTYANIGSLSADEQSALGADAVSRQNLMNFIRGDFSNDQNHNGGLRARITRLGDIVHSEPKYVNGYLYVGANDGMLHVFNASNGQEVFAYIPSFVYSNLQELSNPDYSHRYFVDLSPFLGYAGSDVLLIGGLGKGGKGYFCLDIDISNPGSFTAADVKWEYPDAGSSSDEVDNMGYTFSEPAIVETETAGQVLIFGNGYDSANARAVLYALDPSSGNLLTMIDTGYGSPNPAANNCNGLSTPVFLDSNNNGKADYAYAGDLRGNIWKFDISGAVADWEVAYQDASSNPQPLFQARDSSGNPQPITTRLAVKGHCVKGYSGYIVVFGTGKFNSAGDFTDTSTQAVYGIWDWAAEWDEEGGTGSDKYLGAFNSPSGGRLSNLSGNTDLPVVGDQLTLLSQAQSAGGISAGGEEWGITSSNDIKWFNVASFIGDAANYGSDTETEGYDVGWTYALPSTGERVVADPLLWLDYVLIVSQVPAENMCKVGGTSYLTALDICSGSAPDEPFFNTNGDYEINDSDTVNGEFPSTITLEDFITYSPTMILDDKISHMYFGPGKNYMVQAKPTKVIFWRFLNYD